LSWNNCFPAAASAAFATAGSAAHVVTIVASATTGSNRRDEMGLSLMIPRPQIHMIG
jgi:hypothetical protein